MKDQAEKLRQRLRRGAQNKSARTLAVISGKGGVGKSIFSLNIAVSLSQYGQKVLLFDLDIGMGNIELLAGLSVEKNISHFFSHNIPLREIMTLGPAGIHYIAGGIGLNQFINLDQDCLSLFIKEVNELIFEFDFIIFDMGAGMNHETVQFISSLDEIISVVIPEPTSLMDAYSAIKYILLENPDVKISLVGNRIKNDKGMKNGPERLQKVIKHFLGKRCELIGLIPEDQNVAAAVKRQLPLLLLKPKSPAAKAISKIAQTFINDESFTQNPYRFLDKLKFILLRK